MKTRIHAISILCTVLFSTTVQAEDLPEKIKLHESSLKNGLPVQSVPLLRRVPGPGGSATAEKVKQRFLGNGKEGGFALEGYVVSTEKTDRRVRINGSRGWSILVKGDGSSAKVTNYDYLDTSPRLGREDRLSSDELEALGRKFIQSELNDFVQLDSDDVLVPFKTDYEINTGGDSNGGKKEEEVVSSTIVFSRRVRGIDVVGAGSKIMVTFANDGTPVAFGFDWPKYVSVNRKQKVLNIQSIRERASNLASMRFNADDVEIRRFECGYVDMGGRRKGRDLNAPIQSGCFVHYVGSQKDPNYIPGPVDDPDYGVFREGVVDAIPAGENVEDDQGWRHAVAIQKYGDICHLSELTEAIVPENP